VAVLRVVQGNDLRASKQVAGWAGIQQDLHAVKDMCSLAWDLMGGDINAVERADRMQMTMLHSLFTSALFTYARCFTHGQRTTMDESHVRKATGDEADEAISTHRLYMDLRDKNIAHSVSPFEECQVGIVLTNDDPPQVRTIAWTHVRHELMPGAFPSLNRLADELLVLVGEKLNAASKHAKAQAENLNPTELAARDLSEFIPPRNDEAGQPRSDARTIPASGAWGYVAEAITRDGPDDPPPPTTGTRGQRHKIIVREPDEVADWSPIAEEDNT
jgi:hypothetical protein